MFFGGPVQLPKRQTLKQKCSCGAEVEIDPRMSWSPNEVILKWWQTHPCPNREVRVLDKYKRSR